MHALPLHPPHKHQSRSKRHNRRHRRAHKPGIALLRLGRASSRPRVGARGRAGCSTAGTTAGTRTTRPRRLTRRRSRRLVPQTRRREQISALVGHTVGRRGDAGSPGDRRRRVQHRGLRPRQGWCQTRPSHSTHSDHPTCTSRPRPAARPRRPQTRCPASTSHSRTACCTRSPRGQRCCGQPCLTISPTSDSSSCRSSTTGHTA